ncbi:MAG TPA: DUF378 domain-containing protein [Candidatus Paceibacterota bacterium]
MKALHVIGFILLVVGGLNWGLIGLNESWNVVGMLGDGVARVIYVLVGLAAILEIFSHKKACKACVSSAQTV